jgi:hypothetical protein
VNYDFGELDEVSLAYAVTIHKIAGFRISGGSDARGYAAFHAAPA